LFPNGELIGENQPVVCCSELVIHKKYCGDWGGNEKDLKMSITVSW
jgi:hypothetical protein